MPLAPLASVAVWLVLLALLLSTLLGGCQSSFALLPVVTGSNDESWLVYVLGKLDL
jgi:hypothetical protein